MDNGLLLSLDLLSISIFISVYENHSVTETATEMGAPAPKVSRSIQRIRNAFGNELFVRKKHGLEPNEFADRIYPAAKNLMDSFDGIRNVLVDTAEGAAKTFNIVAPDILAKSLLNPLLDAADDRSKKLRLNVKAWGSGSLDDVVSGAADFGIYSSDGSDIANLLDKSLSHTKLASLNSLYLACAEGHPLLSGEISLETIAEYPHVWCDTGSESRYSSKYQEYCARKSLPLQSAMETVSSSALLACIAGSEYVTVTACSSVYEETGKTKGVHGVRISDVEARNMYGLVGEQSISLVYSTKNKKQDFLWLKQRIEQLGFEILF
ncbi:LysR family transcriptional regulator [Shewanella sp. KX20019]|uniref:LysR family transcriptional regulator n=1 Tax=Shewanella sp. KX20019 TaxID=2803864 RepID=UPI001926B0BA|nr:LysR family transcriptional regulator [Shewanella sp. KX20019]QQX81670.1 LysR family transcriptional regulator [Shewanella sp. KX20019]